MVDSLSQLFGGSKVFCPMYSKITGWKWAELKSKKTNHTQVEQWKWGGTGTATHWWSAQLSRSVVSNSLRPHGLQHGRPPCPSPAPGVYSNSRTLLVGMQNGEMTWKTIWQLLTNLNINLLYDPAILVLCIHIEIKAYIHIGFLHKCSWKFYL